MPERVGGADDPGRMPHWPKGFVPESVEQMKARAEPSIRAKLAELAEAERRAAEKRPEKPA